MWINNILSFCDQILELWLTIPVTALTNLENNDTVICNTYNNIIANFINHEWPHGPLERKSLECAVRLNYFCDSMRPRHMGSAILISWYEIKSWCLQQLVEITLLHNFPFTKRLHYKSAQAQLGLAMGKVDFLSDFVLPSRSWPELFWQPFLGFGGIFCRKRTLVKPELQVGNEWSHCKFAFLADQLTDFDKEINVHKSKQHTWVTALTGITALKTNNGLVHM